MSLHGSNIVGFQNEHNIQRALDQKIYDNINPNLQRFLNEMFPGKNLKGKWVHAQVMNANMKPDFYVTIDNIPGGAYVSVKIGVGNSIHQEPVDLFVNFLKQNGASEKEINELLLFHYADGTTNNTGRYRQTASQFLKENPNILKDLNEMFGRKQILRKVIERVVFQGNFPNAPQADFIYHGDEHKGVWASKNEIYQYLSMLSAKKHSIHAGPLTYQNWNRDVEFRGTKKNGRLSMQFKWGDLKNTLLFITARRSDFKQNGNYIGEISEKASVISFNRNPKLSSFSDYVNKINANPDTTLLIRVTTKQMSRLSNQRVNTRADAYAIEVVDNKLWDLLEENDFYLDETILEGYDSCFTKIEGSGISIKKNNSESYTLIKLTPNSFKELFDSYELGYGASVFCKNSLELHFNIPLLDGWRTTIEDLQEYFKTEYITRESLTTSLEICKDLKRKSIELITTSIDNSPRLQSIIFNGKDIYDEPYSAFFFMQNNVITALGKMPYCITTGSGRSHGDYSVVLKPRN